MKTRRRLVRASEDTNQAASGQPESCCTCRVPLQYQITQNDCVCHVSGREPGLPRTSESHPGASLLRSRRPLAPAPLVVGWTGGTIRILFRAVPTSLRNRNYGKKKWQKNILNFITATFERHAIAPWLCQINYGNTLWVCRLWSHQKRPFRSGGK